MRTEAINRLRERVTDSADACGLTFDQILSVGIDGISHPYTGVKSTAFADALAQGRDAPKTVIQSLCLSAAFVFAAQEAEKLATPAHEILEMLLEAAHHLGFVHGFAQHVVLSDDEYRKKLSEAGLKGSLARHEKIRALKNWAEEASKGMRGDDKGIAKSLATKLPMEFANASKDPERLIYDALRASRNSANG